MIVFTATLILIIAAVVARAGVATSISLLLSVSTCAPGLPRIAAGPDGNPERDHSALRLDRDWLAGEPIQRSRVDIVRPGRGLARCRGDEANLMIVSGSAAQTAEPARCPARSPQ